MNRAGLPLSVRVDPTGLVLSDHGEVRALHEQIAERKVFGVGRFRIFHSLPTQLYRARQANGVGTPKITPLPAKISMQARIRLRSRLRGKLGLHYTLEFLEGRSYKANVQYDALKALRKT